MATFPALIFVDWHAVSYTFDFAPLLLCPAQKPRIIPQLICNWHTRHNRHQSSISKGAIFPLREALPQNPSPCYNLDHKVPKNDTRFPVDNRNIHAFFTYPTPFCRTVDIAP